MGILTNVLLEYNGNDFIFIKGFSDDEIIASIEYFKNIIEHEENEDQEKFKNILNLLSNELSIR